MTLATSLNHPQRLLLASEVHARPFMAVTVPARASHLAVYVGHEAARATRLIGAFCERFGVAPPGDGAQHFIHDFGHLSLKWERHTEFCTFLFVEPGLPDGDPFARPAIRHAPTDWLELLAGSVLVACHVAIESGTPMDFRSPRLKGLFPQPPIVGSQVLAGGEVWTDFQVGPDGYTRFLLRDVGLREAQAGRLVQRLCEIETYRMTALLALPVARESTQALGGMEVELTELSATIVNPKRSLSDASLLSRLSSLAARVEALSLRTNYRFSAAQAYYRLVKARIGDLREVRIEGVPTIGEFMERRLAPAMETCVSAAMRQETLAAKVGRTNDLLRTGVSLAQEQANQHILEQMNRNAQLQLRLQHAVEGLSVVAITYYLLGLVGYVLKAGKGIGLPLNVDAALGLLVPVACGVTWFGIRRLRSRIADDPAGGH
ncbi:MAG: DUF3422 domain-containing protein [Burkholderiales bacterium]